MFRQSRPINFVFARQKHLTFYLLLLTFYLKLFPPVAQLDNAADSDSEECRFKSCQAGQNKNPVDYCRQGFL